MKILFMDESFRFISNPKQQAALLPSLEPARPTSNTRTSAVTGSGLCSETGVPMCCVDNRYIFLVLTNFPQK